MPHAAKEVTIVRKKDQRALKEFTEETVFFIFSHPRLQRKEEKNIPRETKLPLTKISKSS